MQNIRIGTRGSKLALAQAYIVQNRIETQNPNIKTSIIKIETEGDKNQSSSLSEIGGKGVFIKEVQHELLANNIDIAVHSLKDVTSCTPDLLEMNCFFQPESVDDVALTNDARRLDQLTENDIVGTSSLRRIAQLKQLNPKVKIKPIRGNINTRINKLKSNEYDAIILSECGLIRLNIEDISIENLSHSFIPAPGQGVIAIEKKR